MVKLLLKILVVISFTSYPAFSQVNQLDKAKNQYDKYEYVNAQETYLKVAKKGYRSADLFKNLGNSYFFNGQFEEALHWYKELVMSYPEEIEPEYYFRYAQTLKSAERYKESDIYMQKFISLNSSDQRGKLFQKESNYLKMIDLQSKRFVVENASINSEFTDFGVAFLGEYVVFASSRDTMLTRQRIHQWNDEAFLDLYQAKFDRSDGSLSQIKQFDKSLNSRLHESTPTFTKDGNTIYFTRNNFDNQKVGRDNKGTNKLKIYRSYKNTNGNWTTPHTLPFNSDAYSTAHPALSLDEKTLYFSSDMPGGKGQSDLYQVSINGDGSFGEPKNLGDRINTEGKETFPFISASNDLYFATDGHMGLGGLDVFVTSLTPSTEDEKLVINIGKPINSPNDDFAFVIDEISKRGFFSSNRNEGRKDEIYSFIQTEELKKTCETSIIGVVKDGDTKEIVSDAQVTILDENFNIIEFITVGSDGKYETKKKIECNSKYYVRIEKLDYVTTEMMIETPDSSQVVDLSDLRKLRLVKVIRTIKPCEISILGIVKDDDTEEIISDAQVTILDENFNTIEIINVGQDGKYDTKKKIECNSKYYVRIEKLDYVTTEMMIETPDSSQVVDLSNLRKLRLVKVIRTIKPGDDLAKTLALQPIYFDFNDYLIREDAKVELAKVIEVLQQYPDMKIEIRSHTDSRAPADYNKKLSQRRAVKTANYIAVIGGIDRNRLSSKGFGEEELLNDCKFGIECSEEKHQLNRRSEFIVIE